MNARLALLAVAFPAAGCAAILNGPTGELGATSATPGARVYVNGAEATGKTVRVFNDRRHVVLVRAPGRSDRVIEVAPSVRAAPIILDVVLTVPTLAIAPLVDASLGWWKDTSPIDEPVDLAPERAAPQRPRPVYLVGGEVFRSSPGSANPPPTAEEPAAQEVPAAVPGPDPH
jgi:hypothetical protein